LIDQTVLAAIAPTIKWDGTKRDEDVIEEQDNVGPLMTDDKALAMIKSLRVFRLEAGPTLQGAIDDEGDFPRQTFEGSQGFGKPLCLWLGERLKGRDRDRMVAF
jgi:hypothetical protein